MTTYLVTVLPSKLTLVAFSVSVTCTLVVLVRVVFDSNKFAKI